MREALLVKWLGSCGFVEVEGRKHFIRACAFPESQRGALRSRLRLKVDQITPDLPSPRIGRAVIEER